MVFDEMGSRVEYFVFGGDVYSFRAKGAQSRTDRRLCLVIMRQPPRRPGKRKKLHEPKEIPSSVSLEIYSVTWKGNRVSKKRIIEPAKPHPRASPLNDLPNDDFPNSDFPNNDFPNNDLSDDDLSNDNPLDKSDVSGQLVHAATSHSVSVSTSHLCHVITL